ncbi:hypothetical protein NXY42_01975 [Bacteroides fragilis]|nr:hypothetical protein [Bacteroides fragilis]
MYFIHYIQTYASVNRKGSELQEYVLKLKDSLIKNREVLDDLKEELHCRIGELDAKYPRTQPPASGCGKRPGEHPMDHPRERQAG